MTECFSRLPEDVTPATISSHAKKKKKVGIDFLSVEEVMIICTTPGKATSQIPVIVWQTPVEDKDQEMKPHLGLY